MIAFVLIILLLFGLSLACAPGMLAIGIASHVYFNALGLELNFYQYLFLFLLLLAIPFSAYLAGLMLDKFVSGNISANNFQILATVLSFYLILHSDIFFDSLESALMFVLNISWEKSFISFSIIINNLIFCASLAAFCLILLHFSFELPIVFLRSASRVNLQYTFAALRPLGIVLLLSISFRTIAAFYAGKLSVQSLIELFS